MGLDMNLADWMSLLLSFVAVLVLLVITLFILKKISLSANLDSTGNRMIVLQSISLGGRHRLVRVRVHDKELILGVTLSNITLLDERKSDTITDSKKNPLVDSGEASVSGKTSSYTPFRKFFKDLIK